MAYEVDVQINLTVKEGPSVKANLKPKGITDANSKKIKFSASDTSRWIEITESGKQYDASSKGRIPSRELLCKQVQLVKAEEEQLAFVAIKAPRYVFKQCAGVDVSGIGFILSGRQQDCPQKLSATLGEGCVDERNINWITGEYIVLCYCGDMSQNAKWLAVFLDPCMLDRTKNPPEAFELTVIYGIEGTASADDVINCCEDAQPTQAPNSNHGKQNPSAPQQQPTSLRTQHHQFQHS